MVIASLAKPVLMDALAKVSNIVLDEDKESCEPTQSAKERGRAIWLSR